MPRARPLKTDFGTVLLHWVLVIPFVIAVLTGLRFACDEPQLQWLRFLDPVLPFEQVWFRHLVAGLALTAAFAGYAVYVVKARLLQRIRLDRPRLAGLLQPRPVRWSTLNVIVLWLFFIALAIEIVTGVSLFLGAGGMWARLHLHATWACLLFPVLHVALHWVYGGRPQVLRIVHPTALAVPPPPPDFAELLAEHLERSKSDAKSAGPEGHRVSTEESQHRAPSGWLTRFHSQPLVRAASAALALVVLAYSIERTTRPTLIVMAIDRSMAPTIDGDLSDPVWASAPVARVLTRHGANLGGTGESEVEVRAVHDGEFAYFAFTWSDPTRSLKHLPLVKRQDGWHLVQTAHDTADENWFYEDKFSVLLAPSGLALIGAAIHFAGAPLRNLPASLSGRGLHFTSDRSFVDVWLWRAAHGGLGGRVDNCHIGPPAPANPAQLEGRERYTGGFARDPQQTYYDNFVTEGPGGYQGPVQIRRLPRDWRSVMAGLGRIDENAKHSESEGARWWMTEEETMPYSPAADRAIPAGSVIPGAILANVSDDNSLTVRGQARWSAGRWSLEIVKRLDTKNEWDVPLKSGVLMWVAVFDHTETRHTWHLRPLTLEVQ